MLLLNISTTQYNGDTLISYNGSSWENFSYEGYNNSDIENINYEDEKWLLSYTYNGDILDSLFESEGKIYAYQFDSTMSIEPRKIIKGNDNEYWISDDIYGLVKRKNQWAFDIFTPTGPANYLSWNLDFDGEALWVASGSLTPQLNNQYQRKGVYK